MAVTYIASSLGYGTSFSGTVNLGKQFPAAAAQVALSGVDIKPDPGDLNPRTCAVFIIGYTTNGNFVAADGPPSELSVNDGADSFSWGGESVGNANTVGSIMIYCFE
jgi:hypothetical protein